MTARVWQKIDKGIIEILPSQDMQKYHNSRAKQTLFCLQNYSEITFCNITFKVNWSTNIHKLQSSPSFIALNKFSILKVFPYFNLFILSGMWNAH